MTSAAPRLEGVDLLTALPPSSSQPDHQHPWHELVYVLDGRYRVRIGDEQHEGGAGSSFFYPAGLRHRPLRSQAAARIALVMWKGDEGNAQQPLRSEDVTGRIRSGLMWMWDIRNGSPPAPQAVLDGLLIAVLHQRGPAQAPEHDPVTRARHYMAQNLKAVLTLHDVAAAVGVSTATLVRGFRDELETTPMAWRRQLRVETAMTLLRDSSLDLARIARQVGVATPFHLSHLIRKATGRPPRDWRQGRRPS